MIIKINDFFNKMIDSTLYFIICIILAITLTSCFMYVNSSDFIPANDNDYQELMTIKEEISTDFSKIYNYSNYYIRPYKNNMILVTLENDKCKVNCYFKKDLSLENYEKSSTHIPVFLAILVWFGLSFVIIVLLNFITVLVGVMLESMVEKKQNS